MTDDPYYQDDHVTIYHGDCLDVMTKLDCSVDLVFTSPPYNMLNSPWNRTVHAGSRAARSLADGYGQHGDNMPQEEYDEWQIAVVQACWSLLSETGALFYNHKQRPWEGEMLLPLAYGKGLPLRQIVTWDKMTGMNFSDKFFLPKSEWIVIWAKPKWRLKSKSASQVGDVWRVPTLAHTSEKSLGHPAPFPVGLPTMAIESASQCEVIFDPFMGSGSTLRAAKDLDRKAIGIEIEERYCEMAAERCAQEVLDFGGPR